MTAAEFVSNWVELKSELLQAFLEEESEVALLIQSMDLNPSQTDTLKQVVDGILRDTMYSLLLGLDGAASIGSSQQPYTISDENGKVISQQGDIEEQAWIQLQEGS